MNTAITYNIIEFKDGKYLDTWGHTFTKQDEAVNSINFSRRSKFRDTTGITFTVENSSGLTVHVDKS